MNEYDFPTAKVANVQSELTRLVEKNYYLNQAAKDAYRAYVLAYNSHSLKDIFNVHALDLAAVARSFGFEKPRVCFKLAFARLLLLASCTFSVGKIELSTGESPQDQVLRGGQQPALM